MNNAEVARFQARLDDLFERIGSLTDDLEMQAHWAKYLCILCSGFLETAIRAVYRQHVTKCAAPHVVNFVETKLKEFRNPRMQKLLELSGAFKPQWRADLENATEGSLKDAIDSIVDNKNNIAHGRNVGITYTRIKDYYQRAKKVLELVEDQCRQ